MISYWIQRADFSSSDHEVSGEVDVVSAFESHDWHTELELFEDLESRGVDNCPPGFGVNLSDGQILHVCPGAQEALVHYHFVESFKLLGIIPWIRNGLVTALSMPLENVPELIRLFLSGNHEGVLERVEQFAV